MYIQNTDSYIIVKNEIKSIKFNLLICEFKTSSDAKTAFSSSGKLLYFKIFDHESCRAERRNTSLCTLQRNVSLDELIWLTKGGPRWMILQPKGYDTPSQSNRPQHAAGLSLIADECNFIMERFHSFSGVYYCFSLQLFSLLTHAIDFQVIALFLVIKSIFPCPLLYLMLDISIHPSIFLVLCYGATV